jgi:hypothetical protein
MEDRMIPVALLLSGLIALLAISVAAAAQSDASGDKRLAQATRRPTPLSVGKRWNIVARTIMPGFDAPTQSGVTRSTGVGDALVLVSVKPFVLDNWQLAHGWTSYNPIMTASWQAAAGKWTVPVGLGVSNVTTIGRQPVSVGITCFNNIIRPPGTGGSQFRLGTSFLFPKAKEK